MARAASWSPNWSPVSSISESASEPCILRSSASPKQCTLRRAPQSVSSEAPFAPAPAAPFDAAAPPVSESSRSIARDSLIPEEEEEEEDDQDEDDDDSFKRSLREVVSSGRSSQGQDSPKAVRSSVLGLS